MSHSLEQAVKERNYGVDALKVLSMLLIVLLHILLHGGMLWNMATFSDKYAIIWLMYTVTCCAVNCYALISGYVGVTAKNSPGRLFMYWLQAAFYSAGIALLFRCFLPDSISAARCLEHLAPVSHGVYWYFTAYFCVAVFAPILNAGLHGVTEHVLRSALIAGFFLFSLIPVWSRQDQYHLNEGLSAFWLGYLYLAGGYIRLHGRKHVNRRCFGCASLLLFAGCILAAWAWKIFSERGVFSLPQGMSHGQLINNTSPVIVMASVALLAFFKELRIGPNTGRICAKLSALTFGVYLIHDHPLVRQYLVKDRFSWMIDAFDYRTLPFVVMGAALAIFAVCAVIELLRSRLFAALRIREGYLFLMKAVRKNKA